MVEVIESHDENGVEWGLSFSGSNPESKDYFKMANKEEAFRLQSVINAFDKQQIVGQVDVGLTREALDRL